jgi:hypothetical protein
MPALCYPDLQLSLPLVGYTPGDQVESKSLVPVENRWLTCDPVPCPTVPLLVWTQFQECLVDLMIEISASQRTDVLGISVPNSKVEDIVSTWWEFRSKVLSVGDDNWALSVGGTIF